MLIWQTACRWERIICRLLHLRLASNLFCIFGGQDLPSEENGHFLFFASKQFPLWNLQLLCLFCLKNLVESHSYSLIKTVRKLLLALTLVANSEVFFLWNPFRSFFNVVRLPHLGWDKLYPSIGRQLWWVATGRWIIAVCHKRFFLCFIQALLSFWHVFSCITGGRLSVSSTIIRAYRDK